MKEIRTVQDFEAFMDNSGPEARFIFKHSTQCQISAAAFSEFEKFLASHGDPGHYLIKVIEYRSASNQVAQTTGITHETPQALLIQSGDVVWNASHKAITEASLSAAYSKANKQDRPA